MVWGCICAYGMGSLHVLEGTMNAERYIKVLEKHMLPSRRRLFQRRLCVFQTGICRTMQNHILQLLQQHGFVVEESETELACLQSRSFTYREHLKIRQRQPQTLQQLETYIRQEWDQIPTPKLQKLITSMPRRLQTVLKRRGDVKPW